MGAFVEEKFKGGFILDEGKLRKITDLIEKRSGDSPVTFKVYRGDSYSYETSDIDDVINEDNEDWRAITKLEQIVKKDQELDFKLTFSSEGSSIYITGNDRDSVFLIYSDLREYLRNDVLTKSPLSEKTAKFISMLFMVTIMSVFMITVFSSIGNVDPSIKDAALNSTDLNEKINYLIGEKNKDPFDGFSVYWFVAILFLPILVSSDLLEKSWNFMFPTNQFLFGERMKKYKARISLVNKIFWGVGVALIVSIVASIIVWRITV